MLNKIKSVLEVIGVIIITILFGLIIVPLLCIEWIQNQILCLVHGRNEWGMPDINK